MTKTWNDIFKAELKESGNSYLAHFANSFVHWRVFAEKVRKHFHFPLMLEAGAGTGYLSIYFASLGYRVFAVDLDTSFLEGVKTYFNSNIVIAKQDILKPLPNVDLIYNIGVMEHFEDEEIEKIFTNFRKSSPLLIFAVPNFKIPYSFGDERYLSKRHWQRLLNNSGWQIIETFEFNRYDFFRNYLTGYVCKAKCKAK